MKQQTAVEWLEYQLFELRNPTLNQIEILNQAKEMEKNNIKNAFENGQYNAHPDSSCKLINGETYYKQEFIL